MLSTIIDIFCHVERHLLIYKLANAFVYIGYIYIKQS